MPHVAPPELIESVRRKLQRSLTPVALDIRDESPRHAGHSEAAGRFHLRVEVVSPQFRGLDALARHRLVYAALAAELAGPLHAVRLQARTPEEDAAR